MTKNLKELRDKAEKRLMTSNEQIDRMSHAEVCKLVRELNVYQMELEIQNEELKEAQAEVEAQRDKYTELYDFAPVGYITINQKGIITKSNLKCADIIGLDKNDLIQKPLTNLILKDDQDIYYFHQKKIKDSGEAQSFEIRLQHNNGSIFHAGMECAPIFDGRETLREVRIAITDISEIKRAQEELQKQQRLESLGLLAGGLAHDFNNLLSGLFNNIENAKDSLQDKKNANKFLNKALMCLPRTKDLTGQLLTFAKGGEPVKKVISIEPVLRAAVQVALSGSTINCEITVDPKLYNCEADIGQLHQVFTNILLNSRQAMLDGGTIEITAANCDLDLNQTLHLSEGKYIVLKFVDQGIGIPKQLLKKIFDPYFSTKEEGTGLGLAITHSIIKKHSGAINVVSTSGEGTIITIYLPGSNKQETTHVIDSIENYMGTGNILFMDDEPILQDSMNRLIKTLGYNCTVAKNGEEASELYHQGLISGEPFDAVILDLTIVGGLGGQKAMQEILEMDPKAKGVVASGYSNSPVLSNPSKFGFIGSVVKPFKKIEIAMLLKKILS